jgi:hypothetical protein
VHECVLLPHACLAESGGVPLPEQLLSGGGRGRAATETARWLVCVCVGGEGVKPCWVIAKWFPTARGLCLCLVCVCRDSGCTWGICVTCTLPDTAASV